MMSHFLYIIYSASTDVYYKGETADIHARLNDHNNGESTYTKGKGPWRLVYLAEMSDRKSALKREKEIKRLNRRSIEKLLTDPSNKLLG